MGVTFYWPVTSGCILLLGMGQGVTISGRSLTAGQKLGVVAIGMAGVLLLGTIGFVYIEEMNPIDALYMTVITLSTVGFGEVQPLHPLGRLFVIFLIIFGVALTGYTASVLGQIVLEGYFSEVLGRRKMERTIARLENHTIIAGYGRVGRQVAQEFINRLAPFVVIDRQEVGSDELTPAVPFIHGEATNDDILRKAGIERARTLISTLPDEAQNVYLTLTARDMNRSLHIIARADYDDGVKKLRRAGADHVVSPHVLGGQRMALAALRPNVVDFMHSTALGSGGLTIEEMIVPETCTFAGKTLVESNLKQQYGITVIGVKKPGQEMTIAPDPHTTIDGGDILVLIGRYGSLEQFSRQLA